MSLSISGSFSNDAVYSNSVVPKLFKIFYMAVPHTCFFYSLFSGGGVALKWAWLVESLRHPKLLRTFKKVRPLVAEPQFVLLGRPILQICPCECYFEIGFCKYVISHTRAVDTKESLPQFLSLPSAGYPRYSTFLHQSKTSQLCSRKNVWSREASGVPKLPWIGNVSSKFENQINKAITSCFYVVKPRVVYSIRVVLPSTKKIAFLPLKKVLLFLNFPANVKLGT